MHSANERSATIDCTFNSKPKTVFSKFRGYARKDTTKNERPPIEVKLLQKQKTVNTRLQAQQKQQERLQKAQLQAKPTISRKSKALALVAEQKFFAEYFPSYKIPTKTKQVRAVTPNLELSRPESPPPSNPIRELKKEPRNIGRSIYNMSVLERNVVWAERKKAKLNERKKEQLEKEMEGCTFVPLCFAKEQIVYQKYKPDEYLVLSSRNSSPGSVKLR